MYRLLKNKALLGTLFVPQLLVAVLCARQLDNILKYGASGYDIWILFSKDILMTLTFVFPLLSVVYPFVVYENEHRFNGLRTHSILPLRMGDYFLSKVLAIWFFMAFITITSCLLLLILGYAIGGIYNIKEFLLYPPVFIVHYALGTLATCLFLSGIHALMNVFFKNFLVNTLPFLLLLFVSFFLTGWKYSYVVPHTFPFLVLNGLQFGQSIFLESPFVTSLAGSASVVFLLYFFLPRLQHLWIK